jgi:hypothetical protein
MGHTHTSNRVGIRLNKGIDPDRAVKTTCMIGGFKLDLRRSRSGYANHEKTRLTPSSKGENQKHFIEQNKMRHRKVKTKTQKANNQLSN